MSTEYRRGIPSVAHVEAATRLGLEWEDQDQDRWRFEYRNEKVWSDVAARPTFSDWSPELHSGSLPELDYRPISTDGTPVDWEVLDAEAARVVQPATVTPTASATPTTQPQGFRADLWARICIHFSASTLDRSIKDVVIADAAEGLIVQGRMWAWNSVAFDSAARQRADILTRWAVYQELKPLYDIVDGAQGEVAMPRDVEAQWLIAGDGYRAVGPLGTGKLGRDTGSLYVLSSSEIRWRPHETAYGIPLRNFAAVLDAVAEQRVAARQGQATQRQELVRLVQAILDAPAPAINARILPMPEPRRFADVRPDRHGWRWWLVGAENSNDGLFGVAEANRRICVQNGRFYWLDRSHVFGDFTNLDHSWNRRTVIPTDEQGNPVSWESINETARILQTASSIAQQAAQQILGSTVTVSPTTGHVETPLPRFTADELDDVDHSATTTQDSAILKRGKLPTVEAIGKYREVMAKRNGTVTEAVKASGIDCEVAQYVLERWAGGLGDGEAFKLIADRYIPNCRTYLRRNIDSSIRDSQPTRFSLLEVDEAADPSKSIEAWKAQRQRAEAAERKARMAALQAQLAKERAAREAELVEEPTRFSLLEVDEAADPSKSIEAWKAQRAANERRARSTVRPVTATTPEPTPAPRRKPFEVVDAQADGLSGGAAFAVLLSRAMNQNC